MWSELFKPDDGSDKNKLQKFLNTTCLYTEEGLEKTAYSVKNLRCLAILWCNGDKNEKVIELYDMLQDNDQDSIAANDKDIYTNLSTMFDFCTITIL